jgi:hypothetical protein
MGKDRPLSATLRNKSEIPAVVSVGALPEALALSLQSPPGRELQSELVLPSAFVVSPLSSITVTGSVSVMRSNPSLPGKRTYGVTFANLANPAEDTRLVVETHMSIFGLSMSSNTKEGSVVFNHLNAPRLSESELPSDEWITCTNVSEDTATFAVGVEMSPVGDRLVAIEVLSRSSNNSIREFSLDPGTSIDLRVRAVVLYDAAPALVTSLLATDAIQRYAGASVPVALQSPQTAQPDPRESPVLHLDAAGAPYAPMSGAGRTLLASLLWQRVIAPDLLGPDRLGPIEKTPVLVESIRWQPLLKVSASSLTIFCRRSCRLPRAVDPAADVAASTLLPSDVIQSGSLSLDTSTVKGPTTVYQSSSGVVIHGAETTTQNGNVTAVSVTNMSRLGGVDVSMAVELPRVVGQCPMSVSPKTFSLRPGEARSCTVQLDPACVVVGTVLSQLVVSVSQNGRFAERQAVPVSWTGEDDDDDEVTSRPIVDEVASASRALQAGQDMLVPGVTREVESVSMRSPEIAQAEAASEGETFSQLESVAEAVVDHNKLTQAKQFSSESSDESFSASRKPSSSLRAVDASVADSQGAFETHQGGGVVDSHGDTGVSRKAQSLARLPCLALSRPGSDVQHANHQTIVLDLGSIAEKRHVAELVLSNMDSFPIDYSLECFSGSQPTSWFTMAEEVSSGRLEGGSSIVVPLTVVFAGPGEYQGHVLITEYSETAIDGSTPGVQSSLVRIVAESVSSAPGILTIFAAGKRQVLVARSTAHVEPISANFGSGFARMWHKCGSFVVANTSDEAVECVVQAVCSTIESHGVVRLSSDQVAADASLPIGLAPHGLATVHVSYFPHERTATDGDAALDIAVSVSCAALLINQVVVRGYGRVLSTRNIGHLGERLSLQGQRLSPEATTQYSLFVQYAQGGWVRRWTSTLLDAKSALTVPLFSWDGHMMALGRMARDEQVTLTRDGASWSSRFCGHALDPDALEVLRLVAAQRDQPLVVKEIQLVLQHIGNGNDDAREGDVSFLATQVAERVRGDFEARLADLEHYVSIVASHAYLINAALEEVCQRGAYDADSGDGDRTDVRARATRWEDIAALFAWACMEAKALLQLGVKQRAVGSLCQLLFEVVLGQPVFAKRMPRMLTPKMPGVAVWPSHLADWVRYLVECVGDDDDDDDDGVIVNE